MCDYSYAEAIKAACKEHNLETKKLLHLGRSTGPCILDMEEVDGLDKRSLGN